MKKRLPAIVLFFLAPMIGELLLGSAPPAEFFSLFGMTVLTVLYGGGAILARELTLRWGKGWLSLLVLGAAYGIIEEGLMVKSFFDPNWRDIGILGSYGRWLGINWVWSLQLTLYHAVISIMIPIKLTELIFANRRDDSWVSKKSFIVLLVLFTAVIAFGFFFLTQYRPPPGQYWLTVMAVAGLILLARRLPRQPFTPKSLSVKKPFRFWLVGFISFVIFFLTYWVLPNTGIPALITLIIGVILAIGTAWLILGMSGNGAAWGDTHRLALMAGPLSLLILVSPIHEFVAEITDNSTGMTLVGVAALVFILWLFRRVRKLPV